MWAWAGPADDVGIIDPDALGPDSFHPTPLGSKYAPLLEFPRALNYVLEHDKDPAQPLDPENDTNKLRRKRTRSLRRKALLLARAHPDETLVHAVINLSSPLNLHLELPLLARGVFRELQDVPIFFHVARGEARTEGEAGTPHIHALLLKRHLPPLREKLAELLPRGLYQVRVTRIKSVRHLVNTVIYWRRPANEGCERLGARAKHGKRRITRQEHARYRWRESERRLEAREKLAELGREKLPGKYGAHHFGRHLEALARQHEPAWRQRLLREKRVERKRRKRFGRAQRAARARAHQAARRQAFRASVRRKTLSRRRPPMRRVSANLPKAHSVAPSSSPPHRANSPPRGRRGEGCVGYRSLPR